MVVAAEVPPILSSSASVSDDHFGDKDVSSARSSSFQTEGVDYPACRSSSNTTTCNISTPGSNTNNNIGANGSSSPDIHLHHVKTKIGDKEGNKDKATAIMISFESVLANLTRTKETITRATRIAIDCLKQGGANKVFFEFLGCVRYLILFISHATFCISYANTLLNPKHIDMFMPHIKF